MIPSVVKHLVYPLHERLLRRPTFAYLKRWERTQWSTQEEMRELQERRLGDLMRIASQRCPWHARRIAAANIDVTPPRMALTTLHRLPTMTREDAQQNRDAMTWHGVPGGAFRYNTGGSSGTPLIFHLSRQRQAADAANRIRSRRWWGVDVGDRELYLWGSPVELGRTDRIKALRDRMFNHLVLNAFAMSSEAMDEYAEAAERFNPATLFGYASSVALLAAHVRARGKRLRLPSLRVVWLTGEPVYAHQRDLVREVFGVPVASEYGCRDVGLIALESPAEQMLAMSESVIIEVLDPAGRPVAPGELGEAVLTGLYSDAQPFIRYRTGDMLRLSLDPASDGRSLQVVAEVAGRQTDFVVGSDGTIMHALALIYVLRDVDGIGEFKIVQHEVDRFEVQVRPNARWQEGIPAQITAGLKARLGGPARIEVRPVEEIEPEASGKHRYVTSHVPLPAELKPSARPSPTP